LTTKVGKRIRIGLPFFIIFLFLGIIEIRLYHLQILEHEKFVALARKEQVKIIKISSERGSILDRNGQELTVNVPSYSLYVRPESISNPERTARELSSHLNLDESILLRQLKSNRIFLWIKRKLPLSKKEEIDSLHFDGIGWIKESDRFYPQGNLCSHLLGFVGIDNQGLAGVEYYYDEELRGEGGQFLLKADALGNEIPLTKRVLKPLISGNNLMLTVDSIIQSIVEQELGLALKKHQAESVEALFMDPQTGEVLALANKPDYNPGSYNDYSARFRRNGVIQDLYEPGSTFKVVTVSALLDSSLMTIEDKIYCQESLRVANHVFEDWYAFNREMNLAEIIQHSSDIGVIKASQKLSQEIFFSYITLLGFGGKTGIDLPSEGRGIVRSPSRWSLTDQPCISIGQGIAVTPLQMVCALCSLINGGRLFRPYVTKCILSDQGEVIKKIKPRLIRRTVSVETSEKIRYFMQGVVEGGTGKKAKLNRYFMGGKTGTAQIPSSIGKGYLPDKYIASFIGFAPVGSPRIAGIVVVKKPTGAYYASEVAAPLFGRIMKRVLPYMNISSDKGDLLVMKETSSS